MLNSTKYIAILLLFMPLIVSALDLPEATIEIQAGVNIYNDPSGGTASYVEFPFSVNRSQFEFVPIEGTKLFKAAISAKLTISDSLDNKVDSAVTYFFTKVNDPDEAALKDIRLYNYLSLFLEPGFYKGELIVSDAIGETKGNFYFDRIVVDEINRDDLSISDIEFAHKIKVVDQASSGESSRLVKNGLEIIPNPAGIFSEIDTILFIYAELYNLKYQVDKNDSFAVIYRVYDSVGAIYFDYGEIKYQKPGSSAVITNVFDFSSWTPGKYKMELTVKDYETGLMAESSREFSIYSRPDPLLAGAGSLFVSPLDTASLTMKTQWVKFLLEQSELTLFESLNDTGKAEFITQFFKSRDPYPETKKNEYLQDIITRFRYANNHFSSLANVSNGWQTDRGRVLIKYGLSDDMNEASTPTISRAWQVWHYYSIQGGVYFVFEDSDGYGDYRLVHSTAKGEIYSQVWADLIKNNEIELE